MSKVLKADASAGDAYVQADAGVTDSWLTFGLAFASDALAFWATLPGATDGSGFFGALDPILGTKNGIYLADDSGTTKWWNAQGDAFDVPAPAAAHWFLVELRYFGAGPTEIYLDGSLAWTDSYSGSNRGAVSFARLGQHVTGTTDPTAICYIRDVKWGSTRGGSENFADDFSSGDLSAWDSMFGDVSVVDDPFASATADLRLAQRFEIARGRSGELDKTGTGTASVTTFDTQGVLDPTNAGSPFAGKLDPMKQARLTIINPWRLLNENDDTLYNLFRGYVDVWGDFEVDPSGGWITGTVQLVDALAVFAELRMMPTIHGDTPPASQAEIYFEGGPNGYSAGTFKHVDDRQVDVLDFIGWPGTGLKRDGQLRDIFSGNVALLEQIYARADQALTVLDDCADAELPGPANRFITKDGVYAFRGRFARFFPELAGYNISHWYLGGTAQAQADDTVVVISRLPGFRRDAADIINACLALPSGADDADVPSNLVEDATSIAQFGYRSRNIPDLLTYQGHNDDLTTTTAIEETRKFADYRVGNYKNPTTRVTQIEIVALDPRDPLARAQWDFLCGVELSDLITLTTTHPGGGGFDDDFFVEGIHYICEPAPPPKYYNLACTLDVSPRSLYDYNPFGEIDIGLS